MNKLWRKLNKLKSLKPWEKRLLIQLSIHLHLTWLILRMLGFKRARFLAERKVRLSAKMSDMSDLDFARRCAELCSIAARNGLYRANCLHQALALCRVLRRHGIPARLAIGVLPQSVPFQAHAWVELNGVSLGMPVGDYHPFDQFSG